MVGGDRQPCFIVGVGTAVLLHILGVVVVLIVLFKQLLGVLFPCAKVVFIENDQIPVDGMYPLIAALDGAGGLVHTEIVLERAKADDRATLVGGLVGQFRSAGDKLPALKILVGVQVLLPRTDHGGLKGEHQYPLKAHSFCQLVGGKGLAKPHFAVPQKLRVALGGCRAEIGFGLIHRLFLLRAHGKIVGAVFHIFGAVSYCINGSFHIVDGTAEPFIPVLALVQLPKPFAAQHSVEVFIRKATAIAAHGRPRFQHPVGHGYGVSLLPDAGIHIPLGVADLDVAPVGCHPNQLVSINFRAYRWTLREKVHYSSPPIAEIFESIKAHSSCVIFHILQSCSSVYCPIYLPRSGIKQ